MAARQGLALASYYINICQFERNISKHKDKELSHIKILLAFEIQKNNQ